MTKLRWTFGLLGAASAALAALLALVVHGAVEGERRARHGVVAARIFDEMERALTGILIRDDLRAQRGLRKTGESAAVGYFEVYPNGHTYGSTEVGQAIARGFSLRTSEPGPVAPGSTVRTSDGEPGDAPGYAAITALDRGALRATGSPITLSVYDGQLDGRSLLVFRRVEVDSDWHLEGIALDRDRLYDGLAALMSVARIETRSFTVRPAIEAARPSSDPHAFSHRFAAPFDALSADLSLEPLDDAPGGVLLQTLAVALAFALAATIFVTYRTSLARVALAERQGRFASAVTHELRTPLTTLRMYAEMLRDDMTPPESRRAYCDVMVLEAERLGRLVQNVLAHAKTERGPGVQVEPLAIGPIALGVLERLGPHVRARGFAVEPFVDETLPLALADRDALTQVIVNLVDNAIVHADTGRRVVQLRCERRDDRVGLVVRDHGPGIPDDQLAAAFTAFVSLDARGRGIGLGLALVRSLAADMGGEVVAENAPDGGLEVALLLRVA